MKIMAMFIINSEIELFWFISIPLSKKTYPEPWNFLQFHDPKALFKVPKICNMNFWIDNDPPPPSLVFFQKIIWCVSWTLPICTWSMYKSSTVLVIAHLLCRWSLYLSLALCVDHLVGGGDPIFAAVFSSDYCWGMGWSFLTIFFCKM